MNNALLISFQRQPRMLQKLSLAALFLVSFTLVLHLFHNDRSKWILQFHKKKDEPMTFPELFYYNCLTFFTVGSGEIMPNTETLRLLTLIIIFSGFIIAI